MSTFDDYMHAISVYRYEIVEVEMEIPSQVYA